MKLYFSLFIILVFLPGCIALELEATMSLGSLATEAAAAGGAEAAMFESFEISYPFSASMSVEGFNVTMAEARIIEPITDEIYIEYKTELKAKIEWRLPNKDSLRNSSGKSIPLNGAEVFRVAASGAKVMSNPSDNYGAIKSTLQPDQPVMVLSAANGWYTVSTGIGMSKSGYVKAAENSILPLFSNSRYKSTGTAAVSSNGTSCKTCNGGGIINTSMTCSACSGSGTIQNTASANDPFGTQREQCRKCKGTGRHAIQYFCNSCRGSGQINEYAYSPPPPYRPRPQEIPREEYTYPPQNNYVPSRSGHGHSLAPGYSVPQPEERPYSAPASQPVQHDQPHPHPTQPDDRQQKHSQPQPTNQSRYHDPPQRPVQQRPQPQQYQPPHNMPQPQRTPQQIRPQPRNQAPSRYSQPQPRPTQSRSQYNQIH